MQSPPRLPRRRFTAHQGDQLRFSITIKNPALLSRTFLPPKRSLKALLYTALAQTRYRARSATSTSRRAWPMGAFVNQ